MTKIGLLYENLIIDLHKLKPNITISEDSDGGGEVFVCRLNLYLDGSQANLTGPEGDVMVVFLEFWYKWYKVDDNRFLYHFADHDIDGILLEHIKDMYL